MAKKPVSSGKETIKPPTKKELTDASAQLRKGHSSAGRTMADKSVAEREGVGKKSVRDSSPAPKPRKKK